MVHQYPMKAYGQWAGDPVGAPYDPKRCAKAVSDGWIFHQCTRKPGHGDKGLFCKQHAKAYPEVK